MAADRPSSFRGNSHDRELSRASTAAFDDAASFFGAGGTTSDGGYASSGAGGGREGDGSSVTGGLDDGAGGFRRGGDGADFDDDDIDDLDSRGSTRYSRSLSTSPSRRSDITDPLDDFLKRYTISIMPEETVAKLKKRAGPMVFGVNYCPQWDARVTYTAKPAAGAWAPWWLHKLSYSPGSGAGGGRRKRGGGAAASFSDDDDDDQFVEPLEAAAAGSSNSDAASVSGSSVGGVGGGGSGRSAAAAVPAAPFSSPSSSSLRALRPRLPPLQGVATLTSPKLDLFSWLRLQFVADADLATGSFGVRWRVSTKWSTSPGRIGRKERWTVFDGAEIKPRWSVDLYTPEVTGTFGAPQRQLRGGGGARRRRRRNGAGAAAAEAGGSGNGGRSAEDEAAAAAAATGRRGASAGSATDDDDGDVRSATSASSRSLSSSAASFRGRRRGARGRTAAALDLGHCHLLVPRLDAVVDADAAAVSLAKAAKFAAVTPVRVLAGIPLAAARKAAGRVRERKRALLPPPPPQPPASATPASGFGAPFVGPGGLTFPPLPSFLSRSARFFPATTKSAPPPPAPQFAVRGWPWSLGLADGLESAAGWLRRATEEAEEARRRRAGGKAALGA